MSDTQMTFTVPANGAGDDNERMENVADIPSDVVDAEQVAEAEGSLAARLRAKQEKLKNRTKRFFVPPDDVWEGELVLVAKPIKLRANMPVRALVVEATHHLEMLNEETGQYETIEDGWEGIARLMGLKQQISLGEIAQAVCGSPDVLAAFSEQIVAFIVGRQSQIEQALGE